MADQTTQVFPKSLHDQLLKFINYLVLIGQEIWDSCYIRRGEERVMDVMRISSDGQRVLVYHPGMESGRTGFHK